MEHITSHACIRSRINIIQLATWTGGYACVWMWIQVCW